MSWTYHEQINGVDVGYTNCLWVHHFERRRYPEHIANAWDRPQIGLTRKSIRELAKLNLSADDLIKFLYERVHEAECLNTQVCKGQERDDRFVPPYRMKKGYVYFMYCESKKLMKIGCSGDPKKRMSANARDIGAPLQIIRTYETDGMYELENEFHYLFRLRRSHSEWFHIGPKQLVIVEWYLVRKERRQR